MKFNKKLHKLADEILKLPYGEKDVQTLRQLFFKILRKYNIKQGFINKEGNRVFNSPEWIMCETLFAESIKMNMQINFICDEVPENLLF